MNRARKHIKAAKARRDWQRLQEEKTKEVEGKVEITKLKKVAGSDKENSLRDSA